MSVLFTDETLLLLFKPYENEKEYLWNTSLIKTFSGICLKKWVRCQKTFLIARPTTKLDFGLFDCIYQTKPETQGIGEVKKLLIYACNILSHLIVSIVVLWRKDDNNLGAYYCSWFLIFARGNRV